uniref:Uncharacterized protein n=1 Tax=Ciona intestinalis TaxID=7719 RepID=H2XPF0_CIOIN
MVKIGIKLGLDFCKNLSERQSRSLVNQALKIQPWINVHLNGSVSMVMSNGTKRNFNIIYHKITQPILTPHYKCAR